MEKSVPLNSILMVAFAVLTVSCIYWGISSGSTEAWITGLSALIGFAESIAREKDGKRTLSISQTVLLLPAIIWLSILSAQTLSTHTPADDVPTSPSPSPYVSTPKPPTPTITAQETDTPPRETPEEARIRDEELREIPCDMPQSYAARWIDQNETIEVIAGRLQSGQAQGYKLRAVAGQDMYVTVPPEVAVTVYNENQHLLEPRDSTGQTEVYPVTASGFHYVAVCGSGGFELQIDIQPPLAQLQRTPTAQPLPATPTPDRTFSIIYQPVVGGDSHATGQAKACIDIEVVDRYGTGIAGAILNINNGKDVSQDIETGGTPGQQPGYVGICDLGADTWSVTLHWIPPGDAITGTVATISVTGNEYNRAGVSFQEDP